MKIQSLLFLLILKIPSLSILDKNCGSLCKKKFQFQSMQKVKFIYYINFHNFGPKLTNWVFLESGGTGGSEFSIWANLANFTILALCSAIYFALWALIFQRFSKIPFLGIFYCQKACSWNAITFQLNFFKIPSTLLFVMFLSPLAFPDLWGCVIKNNYCALKT